MHGYPFGPVHSRLSHRALTTPSQVSTAAMRLFQTAKMKHQRAVTLLAAVAGTLDLCRPFCEESPPSFRVASLGAQSSGIRRATYRDCPLPSCCPVLSWTVERAYLRRARKSLFRFK